MPIPVPPEINLAGTTVSNEVVPTHVWGLGSEALAAKWGAKWSTGPFSEFRKTFHSDKPLVIVFAGNGEYTGQDWFLGSRPNQEVYLFGENVADPPTLRGDGFALAQFSKWYLKGLDLSGCSNTSQSFRTNGSTNIYVTKCTLRDTVGDQNGWGTPDNAGATSTAPFSFYLWDSVLEQLGSKGNTRHALYIHGRPYGTLWVKGITARGSKGCSLIKSTCVNNYVGYSYLSSVLDPTNFALGLKSSILIDVPADSDTTVESNLILLYRGANGAPSGELGLDNGAIVWRARRDIHASDRPPYMSSEWLDRTFWQNRAKPFRKIVQNNHFKHLASPRFTRPLVAQGTHPRHAVNEFGPSYIDTLGTMYDYWWERDYTDDYGNTYEGFPPGMEDWDLLDQDNVTGIAPLARWGGAPKYTRTVPSVRNKLTAPAIPL